MTILREMFMDVLLAFNVFACNRKIKPPKCAVQTISGKRFDQSRKENPDSLGLSGFPQNRDGRNGRNGTIPPASGTPFTPCQNLQV